MTPQCGHPKESRILFRPSNSGAHERCTDCDAIRYQVSAGSRWWWDWPNAAGKTVMKKLHPKLAFPAAR